MKRTLAFCLAFAVLGALLAAWYWPALPDPLPTHWGADGVPNGFMPKWIGVAISPLISIVGPGIVALATRIDPRNEHVARSWPAISTIMVAIAAFGAAMQWVALSAAASPGHLLEGRMVLVLVGLLWMVLGNVLPKLRSNWFAGIRTPWTLQSEKVWHLTHRVGGWTFALAGLLVVILSLALPETVVALPAILLLVGAAIVPMVYSWFIWKKLHPDGTAGHAGGEGK